MPVRKPDGSIHLCIDFRKLNNVTSPDPFTMPLIDEMLDQLSIAKYLSKLDLNKGFYQIPVREEDKEKTTFLSPWGKYHFNRMPFGLRNAPATFQRLMNTVLAGQEEYSAAYIDDIVIYSNTWSEHLKHIQEVLRLYGLTVKPSKCQWGSKYHIYLWHEVGCGKVSVPAARVEAIKNYKRPKTKKDLQAFLGTTGYYGRFISHYADHSFHLTNAIKN